MKTRRSLRRPEGWSAVSQYRPLAAVVLAAGEGTRMRSGTPKVLHALCGRPMVLHVVDALAELPLERVVIVVGHGAERVDEDAAGAARHRGAGRVRRATRAARHRRRGERRAHVERVRRPRRRRRHPRAARRPPAAARPRRSRCSPPSTASRTRPRRSSPCTSPTRPATAG